MKFRLGIVCGGCAIVLLTLMADRVNSLFFTPPPTKPVVTGRTLSPINLGEKERIEIDFRSDGCRRGYHWIFTLSGGAKPQMVAVDAGDSWGGDEAGDGRAKPIGAIPFTARQCKGLNDLLQFYRHPVEGDWSTALSVIHVAYYAGDVKIGTEELHDYGLAQHLVYARDNDPFGQADPRNPRITPEMISLQSLEQEIREECSDDASAKDSTQGASASKTSSRL